MTVGGKSIDVSKGVVPIVLAFALMCVVATGAFTVGSIWSSMQRDADQFRAELVGIKASLVEMSGKIAALSLGLPSPAERWGRADHIRFCWAAERANPNWKCPVEDPGSFRQ